MSDNLPLLTVLFIMCYFIKKGGNVVYTTITRASDGDYFTDECNNCLEYGAEPIQDIQQRLCRCKSSRFLFLGSEKHCIDESKFMRKELCQRWQHEFIEVINIEAKDSEYTFYNEIGQSSCQLEPLISYHNNSMGAGWQFFNLSENVFALHSGPLFSLKIKVTQVSPSLKNFKGYVMKLGLKCIKLTEHGNTEESSCLLFKAEGKIRFPLDCSTSTPLITFATTETIVTSQNASSSTIMVTPTITCTACTATSSITITPKEPDTDLPPEIIAAIVIGGIVLCLSLIFTVVMYRHKYICRTRRLQARNPDHDFDVIRNPGPQTYRIQEEPLYAEVPDILPCGKGSVGCSTNECEEIATVILNPANVYEARFSVQRRTREPLPSRPEIAGNTNTQVDAGAVYKNYESGARRERAEDSIVFKNPEAEASSSSLPGLEIEPEGHEPERQSIADHHHHVEDDTDNSAVHKESEGTSDDHYQGLVQDKRPHSVFICSSCSDNPVYQRPSMSHSCPHGAKDKLKENRASFYESLRGLELGSRESVYARPSQITGELAAEDKGNRNSEEGEGLPEYHTLEQEEAAVANEDLTEPDNHDYNVLEGPEETSDKKDSISRDPDQTSEDSDLSLEPSKILNMEDNPAYAKPWKTKEDPEVAPEPSDFLNIEHNPLYSTPWKTKTSEPCLKRRAYSM